MFLVKQFTERRKMVRYMEGRTLTGVTSKSRMKKHFFIFF